MTNFDALAWFSHLTENARVAVLSDPVAALAGPAGRELLTWSDALTDGALRVEAVEFLDRERTRLETWWSALTPDVQMQLIEGRQSGFAKSLEGVGRGAGGVLGSRERKTDGSLSSWKLTLFTVGTAFLEMKARQRDATDAR
ncbi:hypothetical protein [Rhodococcus sp. (in: high G+C Gram-positive bacteria)]|uniref:hypothetical protein n=1 Tax=Rhodococcus sp. TaxID=1831 RepID=UPI00258A6876|nr:hypothetical protein [Rhodococcus sp. (in: high G+C Gram-positive bacteria)]